MKSVNKRKQFMREIMNRGITLSKFRLPEGKDFVYGTAIIVLLLLVFITKIDSVHTINTMNQRISKLTDEKVMLSTNEAKVRETGIKLMNTIDDVIEKSAEQSDEYASVINELDEQNKQLMEEKEEAYETLEQTEAELAVAADRLRLYEEYKYTLYRGNKRTDITYEQLKLGEDLMRSYELNPHWLFGTLMVESEGDSNAKSKSSSAKGYGQFVDNTGRDIWENKLGNGKGTYSASVAYNGDSNIRMMAMYMNVLYQDNKNTNTPVYNSIRQYRGRSGSILNGYIKKIDSYIETSGQSIRLMDSK